MFSTSGDGTRTTMSPWRWISNDSVGAGAAERLMGFGLGSDTDFQSPQGNRPPTRNQANRAVLPPVPPASQPRLSRLVRRLMCWAALRLDLPREHGVAASRKQRVEV